MADAQLLRALNNHIRIFFHRVLEGLSDEQINYSTPAIDGRSIAAIVLHAYSGVFIFSSVIAGKARPTIPTTPTTIANLLALIDQMHDETDQALTALPAEALEQTYTMPWGQKMSGVEALTGALAHNFIHIGNIQGIRAIGGFPTPPESY